MYALFPAIFRRLRVGKWVQGVRRGRFWQYFAKRRVLPMAIVALIESQESWIRTRVYHRASLMFRRSSRTAHALYAGWNECGSNTASVNRFVVA